MIGILVVTHGRLGEALIDTASFILDETPENLAFISIDISQNPDKLRKKITDGIKSVSKNYGVLILTDMFGGTPSNLSYSFLEEGRIEVLSGVNLPILIKALNLRGKTPIHQIGEKLEEYGKKSITAASGILKGNKRGANAQS